MNPRIASLEKMIDGPRDGALLRFSLGNEYLKEGALGEAEKCFRNAVDRDKHYSAAWKALGKTLVDAGRRHSGGEGNDCVCQANTQGAASIRVRSGNTPLQMRT